RAIAYATAGGMMVGTIVIPFVRSRADARLTFFGEWIDLYRHGALLILAGLAVFLIATFDVRTKRLLREWRPRMGGFVMFLSVGVGAAAVMQWREWEQRVVDQSRNF